MSNAALDSSVTLEEVFSVLSTKRVPMAPELAGYLVLELAERIDQRAGEVDPNCIFLGEEGTVAFVRPRRSAIEGDTETSIRRLLARLLEASGSPTPALSAAARRTSTGGLEMLATELETALIPVNRAAGRRALARLAREVRRVKLGVGRNAHPSSHDTAPAPTRAAVEPVAAQRSRAFSGEEEAATTRRPIPSGLLKESAPNDAAEPPTTTFEPAAAPFPSPGDVDALIEQFGVSDAGDKQHARALGNMVGLEPTPPPVNAHVEVALPYQSGTSDDSDVETLIALGADPARPPAAGSSDPRGGASRPEPPLPTVSPARSGHRPAQPSAPAFQRSRLGPNLLVIALLALAVVAYLLLRIRPLVETASPAPPVVSVEPQNRAPQAAGCSASLVVTGVPLHAEVLLREGQAPLDVEKMPVGARLEFVATAEGYAPKRVVVPAGATWDVGGDGRPRFEAAVQLDKSKARGGNDPWPPSEPGSEVGGQGSPGTVRVVATPRGAEIWMLAGIGPEARVEQLRCDRELDVLVAGPTVFRKRLHVATTDFEHEASGTSRTGTSTRVARVSAQ